MKKILITGSGSFLGKNLERYLMEYNAENGRELYQVDRVSQRDSMWETFDMHGYDVVFQASGIAHVDTGKVSPGQKEEYYKVNCNLAVTTARRAFEAGVKQFIYPSSVIIYGDSAPLGQEKRITQNTVPCSAHFYGDSKIQAEKQLSELQENYRDKSMVLLRLPMVYGKGSKGNYPLLSKIAAKTPVFPAVENQRSMIYVDNLCECIRQIMEEEKSGIFYPQNKEYVSTAKMVQTIARVRGKKISLWKVLNPLVVLAGKMPGKIGSMVGKAFGNLTIAEELSQDRESYCIYSFEESIRRTEG